MKKTAALLFSMLATQFSLPVFAQEKSVPALDPNAIAALVKMGGYLRGLKAF